MKKELVFIDDSGDPGFKSTSSANLVMAAAVFIDADEADKLSKRISEYQKSLSWRKNVEFKFSKDLKSVIIDLLKITSEYDFEIYAVYINKNKFRKIMPVIDKTKLYNWTIVELLKNIPFVDAKISIDGRSSKQNMLKTASYIRHEIKNDRKNVEIRFEESKHNNLIQLADLIAGSINRSLSQDKTDAKVYIKLLNSKIKLIKEIA